MYKKLIATAAIVIAAAALAGLASAGGAGTKQGINLSYVNGKAGKMLLTPLTSGPVLSDTGAASWCCWTQKVVQRDGEQLDVNNPLATFVGKNGSLIWREQITWQDLGAGYSVATGTWRVVRGTGAYEHLAGQGHLVFITGTGGKTLAYRAVGLIVSR